MKKSDDLKKGNVKNIIENSKNVLNDENLLNIDLDDTNLDLMLNKIEIKKQSKGTKKSMYKNFENLTDKEKKSKRQKFRKLRLKFIENTIFYMQNNLIEDAKKEIKLFEKFYTDTYILNDYSLDSFCENNSDTDTKIKCKLFLAIRMKLNSKK